MPIITVLSYNSLQKPLLINEVKNEYKNERNEYFSGEIIENYDVIALQEQFSFLNPRPIKLLEKALEIGFNYYYRIKDPRFTEKALIDGGLVTLSKFPIIEADQIIFDPPVSRDRVMQKGVIWTLIQLPNNKRLHVFNTHLLAVFEHLTEDVYISCRIRTAQQIFQLRKFMKEKIRDSYLSGDLAILCSDLNVDARNESFNSQELLRHLEIDKGLGIILQEEKNELKFFERIMDFNNDIFKPVHVFYKQHGHYPTTVGDYEEDDDGNRIPIETIITAKELQLVKSNPDHIYELKVKGKDDRSKLRILPRSATVEKFLVHNQLFTQLSDHFGLSLKIEYI